VVVNPQRVPRRVGICGEIGITMPVLLGGNVDEVQSPALWDEESERMTPDSMPPTAADASTPEGPLPKPANRLNGWSHATGRGGGGGGTHLHADGRGPPVGCAPSRVRALISTKPLVVRLAGVGSQGRGYVIIGRDASAPRCGARRWRRSGASPRNAESRPLLHCLRNSASSSEGSGAPIACQISVEPNSAISRRRATPQQSMAAAQPGVLYSTSSSPAPRFGHRARRRVGIYRRRDC